MFSRHFFAAGVAAVGAFVVSCSLARELNAQWTRPDSGVRAYLATAGAGPEFFSWFGHAALIIADGDRHKDYWYDYGIINDDSFSWNNITGRVRAHVRKSGSPRDQLARLERDDRSVLIQELLLTRTQISALMHRLDRDVVEFGTAGYDYRHFDDNCSTRIRDVIDAAADGALKKGSAKQHMTTSIRDVIYRRFAARSLPMLFGADLVAGRPSDKAKTVWESAFLPELLGSEVADAVTLEGAPLARETYRYATRTHGIPSQPSNYRVAMFVTGLGVGVLALLLAWPCHRAPAYVSDVARITLAVMAAAVTLVLGISGILILFFWTFTQYTFAFRNENLLFANPLVFALLPATFAFATKLSGKASEVLKTGWMLIAAGVVIALLAKLAPGLHQDNWRELLLMIPLAAGFTSAFAIMSYSKRHEMSKLDLKKSVM